MLRVLVPALLIIVWVGVGGIGGPYFGKVSEVSSNDQTTYLPSSAEATLVQERLADFRDSDAIPAVVVATKDTAFSDAELETLADALDSLPGSVEGVSDDISPFIPSEDGLAAQAFVPLDSGENLSDHVNALGDHLRDAAPSGVTVYVTGPAGFTADLVNGFAGIDGLLLGVALIAVFIILVIVYRSLLLPVAVLGTSMMALTVALLVNWWLAKWGVFMLSGQTQGILFILVIGAATDYSLLYVSRYREQLRLTHDKGEATMRAIRGSIEPILASGFTVIAGLLCLLLSDLKSNSSLGPVAAVGIVFSMLAALTLLPAILFAFGRAAFWPRRPRYEPEVVAEEHGMPRGVWARLAAWIRSHHRPIWIVTTLALVAGLFGATHLDASGVAQSELVLGVSEARDGQAALGEHFPGGSGSPAMVVTPSGSLQRTADALLDNPGVDSVAVVALDAPSGTAPVTADGITAFGPPGTEPPAPTVSRGDVLLQATLTDAADSDAAQQTVRELREALASGGAGAGSGGTGSGSAGSGDALDQATLVGGVTATAIDTNDASIHDRALIIPIVLAVILVILMMLLRSIVAPIILIATTVLSFGTALGVAGWMFKHVFDFPGADPAVPLYSFVFLVALGIDYNIFLMTRVREESLRHGTLEGISRGLAITGGVITSAGLVLAATFAALSVIPILFLVQIAFIVAFGVLLDTFIVRSLLVPALATDIGRAIWWPSRLSRGGGGGAGSGPGSATIA
nr:efflux RND transporter permease subunit [Leucobacter chinensis]